MEAALKEDTALKEGADALLKDEGVEAGEEVPLIPLPVEGASNNAKTAVEEEKAMAEEEAEKATAEQVSAAKAVAAEKAATVEKAEEEGVVLEDAAATAAKAEARAEERTHDLARRKSENLADKAQNLARLKEKDEVRGSRPSSMYLILPSEPHSTPQSFAAACAQYGRLPLHVAAMQQGTCAAVTVLLNAYPEAIAVKDNVRGCGTPSTSISPRRALAPLVCMHFFSLHGTRTPLPSSSYARIFAHLSRRLTGREAALRSGRQERMFC